MPAHIIIPGTIILNIIIVILMALLEFGVIGNLSVQQFQSFKMDILLFTSLMNLGLVVYMGSRVMILSEESASVDD